MVGFVTLPVWGLLEGAALIEAALLPEEVLIPVAEGPVDAIVEALPLARATDIVKPPSEITDADGCVKSVHDPAHEMP